ncbi:MAG: hypothetical protein BWZ02_03322 [Lentisphaerae bacterium ADurb.BinA184]|nr:MAG: hypothetical protein BWZ02_03322 [Lentisphaerae bacterium ADurb.BinA184]
MRAFVQLAGQRRTFDAGRASIADGSAVNGGRHGLRRRATVARWRCATPRGRLRTIHGPAGIARAIPGASYGVGRRGAVVRRLHLGRLGNGAGQVGQCRHGVRLLPREHVGIATHGQFNRRVPHDALRHLRMRTAGRQQTPGGVAQGVEVRHAPGAVGVAEEAGFVAPPVFRRIAFGFFQPRHARRGQVRPEHVGRSAGLGRHVEGGGVRQLAGQEVPQIGRGVGSQGQGVLSPVLAVGGVNRHRRRIAGQVKACPRQACQFRRAQAGFQGQPVEHGPFRPRHSVALGSAGPAGHSQQPTDFLNRQRPSIMPPVGLDVQAV